MEFADGFAEGAQGAPGWNGAGEAGEEILALRMNQRGSGWAVLLNGWIGFPQNLGFGTEPGNPASGGNQQAASWRKKNRVLTNESIQTHNGGQWER